MSTDNLESSSLVLDSILSGLSGCVHALKFLNSKGVLHLLCSLFLSTADTGESRLHFHCKFRPQYTVTAQKQK